MPTKKANPTTKKAATKTTKVKKTVEKPTLEDFLVEIQKRAYDVYVERTNKGLSGDELSDWLTAEKEVKEKYNIK